MGDDKTTLKSLKDRFMKMWECRDLGKVKEYLGMRILRDRHSMKLSIDQNDYALKVVQRFGQHNCKPVRTPLPAGCVSEENKETCTSEQRSYFQSIIGSLLYLALGTRPDIEFAVIHMSQFSANPSEKHIQQALYIIRYVASTLDAKITYDGKSKEGFIAYADADWAGDPINRKSVTSYVVKLAGSVVSWKSRKQKTLAHSSTEAEYMALSDASRQISWIQNLYKEIGFKIESTILCGDNQGAIFIGSNPTTEKRTKHIDIRFHYIRECIEEGKIILYYIPTKEQIADILTKNLSFDKFKYLRSKLGLIVRDNRQ
jgi:hypothetical protein